MNSYAKVKIVYNSKGYGLQLTADEMQMIASKLNLSLAEHKSCWLSDSTKVWFAGVDWMEFRKNDYLVSLVEQDKLSNKDLRIVELFDDDDWYIETDWHTMAEDVMYADKRYVSAVTGYDEY